MSDSNASSSEGVVGFDQTNGVVSGLDGDSDGTQEGEQRSTADREEHDAADDSFVNDAMETVYGQPDKARTGQAIPDSDH